MELPEKEKKFLARRRWRTRYWPVAGTLLSTLIAGTFSWFLLKSPHFINPYAVSRAIQDNSISGGKIKLMALMLPVMSVAMFLVMISLVALMWSVFLNEKKYLAIIEKLQNGQ